MAVVWFQAEELPKNVDMDGSCVEPEAGKNLCYFI
jgi:hypothetical protein